MDVLEKSKYKQNHTKVHRLIERILNVLLESLAAFFEVDRQEAAATQHGVGWTMSWLVVQAVENEPSAVLRYALVRHFGLHASTKLSGFRLITRLKSSCRSLKFV